jgi:hypothetical protein
VINELRAVIETFVGTAVHPALLDPGEEPLPLLPDQWSMSEWNGRLVLQAWDQQRNLVRKVVGLKDQKRDRINLLTERFHKNDAEIQIADLAAPMGRDLSRKALRTAFAERFQLMLAREWPEWRVMDLTAEANLEESLSNAWVRAFLRNASTGMAVMAAPPDCGLFAGIIPAGLIWLDYLRRRERDLPICRLLLYVPLGVERDAAFRASCLDHSKVDCLLFAFDEKDRAGLVDFADAGNLDSMLPPRNRPPAPNSGMPSIPEMADVDQVLRSDGSISLQVRGLEFARAASGKLTCGVSRRRRASLATVEATAREIARVRSPGTPDRQHPLYCLNPEGWLEAQVRAHPDVIDASVCPTPIYGQVPIFSGPERGVIDLLGIDHTGRLVVIELKATADMQLPFQALDYWLRVRKHLAAGDFERLGYFPGRVIRPESPRILLVAPALEFHSTSELLISAFASGIEVTRIGLGANWRSELRVMFRLRGNERP